MVYAPPGAAPDPVFPASPGAAHAPVVLQERSGPTVLDSKHEEQRRKKPPRIIFFRSKQKKQIYSYLNYRSNEEKPIYSFLNY